MQMTSELPVGEIRYIKLGRKGAWAREAFEAGTLPLGYHLADHADCVAGRWDAVRQKHVQHGSDAKAATGHVREIREFYELGPDTLWITFADGRLRWAFADVEVELRPPAGDDWPSRVRRIRGRWRSDSLAGRPLLTEGLSSALTKVAGYRGTICRIGEADYLLRQITGERDPLLARASALKADLVEMAEQMIEKLHWREFETLVDLIFARGGWRRTSALGGDMPDIDLVLDQPITGERAWVQVKTATNQRELAACVETFQANGAFDRFFFVSHVPAQKLNLADDEDDRLHLWTADIVSVKAIEVGLLDWLVERTR